MSDRSSQEEADIPEFEYNIDEEVPQFEYKSEVFDFEYDSPKDKAKPEPSVKTRTPSVWTQPQAGPSQPTIAPLNPNQLKTYYNLISHLIPGVDELDCSEINEKGYLFSTILGAGSYGCVYAGKNRTTNAGCAIKVLKVGSGHANQLVIQSEMDVIGLLNVGKHNNIVEMISMFSNDDLTHSYIVLNLTRIPDLFNILQYVNDQNIKVWVPISETVCRYLIHGIAEGIRYMKQKGVAHGDIKLANVLLFWKSAKDTISGADIERLKTEFSKMTPKLTDFSNSKMRNVKDPPGQIMTKGPLCSVNFAAPESYDKEVFKGIKRFVTYDTLSADVFSIGVNLLSMLLGAYPYDPQMDQLDPKAPDYQQKFQLFTERCNKMKKDFGFTKQICRQYSPPLREVLLKLLNPNPELRINVEQFLADKWVKEPKALEAEDIFDSKSQFSRYGPRVEVRFSDY